MEDNDPSNYKNAQDGGNEMFSEQKQAHDTFAAET